VKTFCHLETVPVAVMVSKRIVRLDLSSVKLTLIFKN
jgi:hypothetical protein